jgi:hypothetical protein
MGLLNMSHPKDLSLTDSQAQGSVGLSYMLDPKDLSLVVDQVQDSVGLANISYSKYLDSLVSHLGSTITKLWGYMHDHRWSPTLKVLKTW